MCLWSKSNKIKSKYIAAILEKDDINLPTINVEKDDNLLKEKVLILNNFLYMKYLIFSIE